MKIEDTTFAVKNEENVDCFHVIDLTNSGDEDIKIEGEASNAEEVSETVTEETAQDNTSSQQLKGIFSYEESMKLLGETTEPFLGYFATGGRPGTYNTKGDWRNFLTFYEIIQHFDKDNVKLAQQKIAAEIVKDPGIALNWIANTSKGEGTQHLTPFKFRFSRLKNYQAVINVLKSQGIEISTLGLEDCKEKRKRTRTKTSKT